MANNNFTELFSDGNALTQTQLETAFKTLTLDISNTTQMTTGSSSGTFLVSNGSGVAASFAPIPDPLGPNLIRNYGISASATGGTLKILLKTNAGANPSVSSPVDIPFSTNGTSSATYTNVQVTAPLSFTVSPSASLGLSPLNTSTQKFTNTASILVFLYAINNNGTTRLAVSAKPDLDVGSTLFTSPMSHSAKSNTALYATASLNVVPRLLGYVQSAIDQSGNWQFPTRVSVSNQAFINQYWGNSNVANAMFNEYTRPAVSAGTSTVAIRGVALSASSGSFNTTATSATPVVSVSLTTQGRPVRLEIIDSGDNISGSPAQIVMSGSETNGRIMFKRDGTQLTNTMITQPSGAVPLTFIDTPVTAGTHTYTLYASAPGGGNQINVLHVRLAAYEL